jgi:MFS family permease
MSAFTRLLRQNRNYRYAWMGQVVSEIGDHFNNIAVFSLALAATHSGMVVTGIMLSRAVPAVLAGPLAGILLDRMDRRRIMIASDLVRAFLALGFLITIHYPAPWLLNLLSGLLMLASPFFSSGRASILPAIASKEELHTANSLTQTTQWTTLTLGTLFAGIIVARFGYEWAFLFNGASFLFSAWAIQRMKAPGGQFRAQRKMLTGAEIARPWRDYMDGLRYIRRTPLIMGVAVVSIGWASGGGAAQILFSLFGEMVFNRGAAGIGEIWACAGLGLLAGGSVGHWYGKRARFNTYKKVIAVCYVIHGGAYILFSQMHRYWLALVFIALSRAAVAVSSVLNMTQLLRTIPDMFRGRVFSTLESLTWAVMMVSMMGAGLASVHHDPRVIGMWSGILSSLTAIAWGWLDFSGKLPEPSPTDQES